MSTAKRQGDVRTEHAQALGCDLDTDVYIHTARRIRSQMELRVEARRGGWAGLGWAYPI